jgi:hypothetical protein
LLCVNRQQMKDCLFQNLCGLQARLDGIFGTLILSEADTTYQMLNISAVAWNCGAQPNQAVIIFCTILTSMWYI